MATRDLKGKFVTLYNQDVIKGSHENSQPQDKIPSRGTHLALRSSPNNTSP